MSKSIWHQFDINFAKNHASLWCVMIVRLVFLGWETAILTLTGKRLPIWKSTSEAKDTGLLYYWTAVRFFIAKKSIFWIKIGVDNSLHLWYTLLEVDRRQHVLSIISKRREADFSLHMSENRPDVPWIISCYQIVSGGLWNSCGKGLPPPLGNWRRLWNRKQGGQELRYLFC